MPVGVRSADDRAPCDALLAAGAAMIGFAVIRAATRMTLLLAAAAVAACGDATPRPQSAGGAGNLVVQKSLASGPIFIEGSVTHLRIVQEDGSEIVDELRPVDTLDVPILDRALPAGSYRLAAVERPCAAN